MYSKLEYIRISKLNALSVFRVYSVKLCQEDTFPAMGKLLGIVWKFTHGHFSLTLVESVRSNCSKYSDLSHTQCSWHSVYLKSYIYASILRNFSNAAVSVCSGFQVKAENFHPVI